MIRALVDFAMYRPGDRWWTAVARRVVNTVWELGDRLMSVRLPWERR